jgi:hypothetical protein
MASFAESAIAGYKLGGAIGTDIAEKNILRDVYAGTDVSTMTPEQNQQTLLKASYMAKQKGLDSVSHSFQKEASEVSKAAGEQQLNKINAQIKSLDLGSRVAKNANNKEDLYGALNVAGLDTNTKMVLMQQIDRFQKPDGTFDIQGARKMVTDLGTSETTALNAQLKLMNAEERVRHNQTMEMIGLDRVRNAAAKQGGSLKPAKGFEVKGTESVLKSMFGKEMLDSMSDEDWTAAATKVENKARQIAKSEGIDLEDAKDQAINELFKPTEKSKWFGLSSDVGYEYEKGTPKAPAPTATKEATKETKKETKFKEGRIYTDARGNRAMYNNGQWVPQ